MNFKEYLKNNIVYLDGGMGTLLQQKGLMPGQKPENWNVTNPDIITGIHKEYFDAGSNVICTNTFGANTLKFPEAELEKIIKAALDNAKSAREQTQNKGEKFIALDIGPTGKLLKPYGDLDFEDAVAVFSKTCELGEKYGADLIFIETMNDSYETKAAVIAAKESTKLPVIVSNAYGEDEKLMTGANAEAMLFMLEGLGVDAIGANCSLGPDKLSGVITTLLQNASVPVLLKPNAGLPEVIDGKTVYNITAEKFAGQVTELIKKGVRLAGGCCGTTPLYIKALTEQSKNIKPEKITDKSITAITSYTHAVRFSEKPLLIGERINPTGKKRFKKALIDGDIDYILQEASNQQQKGVDILDVNVGLAEIDEKQMLEKAVFEIQAIIDIPLQIDTSDVEAMEKALRKYNGKAMINSVCGKDESMDAIFPLVKKYGGVVVALTLDQNGIPSTIDGRFEIAKKILKRANEYGISKKDIVFDTLAMTVSADQSSAICTLGAQGRIKNELGCHTILGVSNISFGLPNRDAVNSTFFALALQNGLSSAIMNPYSADMMRVYYTYNLLKGFDKNCEKYLEVADSFGLCIQNADQKKDDTTKKLTLKLAIEKGFKEKAAELTQNMLPDLLPLDIVNSEIIPALNEVGRGFENKTVYLPSLLMSAEAAANAFEVIKSAMKDSAQTKKGAPIIIATVKGDIHDIGKNIVKLLLENYGFDVIDLGKDVAPETIVQSVISQNAPIATLSALMTTTVPAMEETIKLLKKQAPFCKVIVGGAVLTQEYADKIGADKYAKDAMEAVRYAQQILK